VSGHHRSRRQVGPTGAKGTVGHSRPTRAEHRPSGAHSWPSLPTGTVRPPGEVVADPRVTVVVPNEPPQLTPAAARALLRILLGAGAQEPGPSGEAQRGGRTSRTPAFGPGEEARRAS
jgi:hypothetical protein